MALVGVLWGCPVGGGRGGGGASAPAMGGSPGAGDRHVFFAGQAIIVTPRKSAASAPSGRRSAVTHARAPSSIAARLVRAASVSAHSLARRSDRAKSHANGTTSIPLAAHQVNALNERTIAAADAATALLVRR